MKNRTKTLPAGRKLINATWKASDFWLFTRAMREDEKPETYNVSKIFNLFQYYL